MVALALRIQDGILFLVCIAVSALITPVAAWCARKFGLVDQPAPHKFHTRVTPYLGGMAIVAAIGLALIVSMYSIPSLRVQLIGIAGGVLAVATIGLMDDWIVLNPTPRLLVQSLAACGLWATGIRVTPTGILPVDLCLTIFVVMAITNAVNLLDNMDGLSSGAVAIAAGFFYLVTYSQGQRLVSVLALALAGACLGFLPYNFNPARIFLGDAGTMAMGFLTATLAIKLNLTGYPVVSRITIPTLILGVILFDMSLVVFSRSRGRRRVFRGGTDHSSHRLVRLGASPRQAALITYAACAASGSAALLLVKERAATFGVAEAIIALAIGLALIWQFERVPLTQAEPSEPGLDQATLALSIAPASTDGSLEPVSVPRSRRLCGYPGPID